jgi:hypothetical protein
MSELDSILDSTLDNTLGPYIDRQYNTFMNKLPSGIQAGATIPSGISVPPNSNWKTVPTKNEFRAYVINQINNSIWNKSIDITIPIPLYLIRYLFNYSYIISFIGAIAFSVLSTLQVDITSVVINKNLSLALNVIIICASICASILWFFHQTIIDNLSTTINNNLPVIN